ncbi:MAG TPA: ABC transporter substrate-binding protein, partial [Actinomycetota bacterium]|nr:ABC transporter substrate-binding protein [Actinomycetota bacterium]
ATDHVLDTISIPGRGSSIAAGGGALWVTAKDSARVWRIDPATHAKEPLPIGTSAGVVAVSDPWVWVADPLDGTLWKYTLRGAPNDIVPAGASPVAITFQGDDVWVANQDAGTISLLDPASKEPRPVDLAAGARPTGVVVADGFLWVASRAVADTHRGGTLHLASATGCTHVDPTMAIEIACADALSITSDGLLAFDHAAGGAGFGLVPDLATSVPPGDGHTTYRFHIRPGIRYSDGTPLRAADFRWALERTILMGQDGGSFNAVRGVTACRRPESACDLSPGVAVAGDSITFHLVRPDPDFLFKLVRLFPVPPGTPAEDVGLTPIPSTGPYRITHITVHGMTLVRNPEFHEWSAAAQPAGYPDRIEWTFGASPNAAVSAIESDRADWSLDPPPPDRLFELETRFHPQLTSTRTGSGSYFLILNARRAPFDDIRVRRAVALALDPSAAVQHIGGHEYGSPACGFIPPNIPGGSGCRAGARAEPSAAARLERARRLLRGAPRPFAEVPVLVSTLNGVDFASLGRYVVSVLHRLGIPARLHVQTVAGYFPNFVPKDRQYLAIGYWTADYPSASDFLPLVSCASITPGAAPNTTNWSNFCDKRIDAAAQRALADEAAGGPAADATAQWTRMNALISADAPVIPLVVPNEVDLVSSRVGNVVVHPLIGLLLSQLWVR